MSEPKLSFRKYDWPSIEDGKIPTVEFLSACGTLIQVFGVLGKMFIPVKRDVQGNITKLQLKFNRNPQKYSTLNEMIDSEVPGAESATAIESLLWLKRGLHFIYLLLNSIIEGYETGVTENSLVVPCLKAYEASLKEYHPWAMQKIVITCIKSPLYPKRNEILKSIAYLCNDVEAEIVLQLKHFVSGLGTNLKCIFQLYTSRGLDTVRPITIE